MSLSNLSKILKTKKKKLKPQKTIHPHLLSTLSSITSIMIRNSLKVTKRQSLKVKLNQILRVRQKVKVIVNLEVMPKKRLQRLKNLLKILQKLRKELMLK